MFKIICLTLFSAILAISFSTNAQFVPGVPILENESVNYPETTAQGDLDLDGDIDIVAASSGDHKVSYFENQGNMVFKKQVIITSSFPTVRDVELSDLDGDGDLDIVFIAGISLNRIENLGQMNFSTPVQLVNSVFTVGYDLETADIDNDGDNDIIGAAFGSDLIFYLSNLGGNNFSSIQTISVSQDGPTCIAIGDMNGDSFLDIIVSSKNDNEISLYLNLGGAFGTAQVLSSTANSANKVICTDMDGDGDKDIIAALLTPGLVVQFANLGSGIFGSQTVLQTVVANAESVVASDIDGDGDRDLITSFWSGTVFTDYVLINNGNATYQTPQVFSSLDKQHVGEVNFADLDGDIDQDAIISDWGRNSFTVRENLGLGVFGSHKILAISLKQPTAFGILDMGFDGGMDALVATSFGLFVFEQDSSGYLPVRLLSELYQDKVSEIETFDIDEDGDDDILYTYSNSSGDVKIAWSENQGNNNFDLRHDISNVLATSATAFDFVLNDMDMDGDKDVVAVGYSLNKTVFIKNLGSGNFAPESVLSTVTASRKVCVLDMDNDGLLDICREVDKWNKNLGLGLFGPEQQTIYASGSQFTPGLVYDLVPADVDNDGKTDLLYSVHSSVVFSQDRLVYRKQIASGTFGPEIVILLNEKVIGFSVGDLNMDGQVDIVYNSTLGKGWKKNTNGVFGSTIPMTAPLNYLGTTKLLDFDLDNDLDVFALGNYNLGFTTWVSDCDVQLYSNLSFNSTQVSGQLFVDLDQDGVKDSTDQAAIFVQVASSPQSAYSYTNNTGVYYVAYTDTIGTYVLTPSLNNNWHITSDSSSYHFTISANTQQLDSLNFGIYPNVLDDSLYLDIVSGIMSCNSLTSIWVNIHNLGTTTPNGIVHLVLDDSLDYVSSDVLPDSIIGQNLYWSFDSLFYFDNSLFTVAVTAPDFNSMFDTIVNTASVYYTNLSGNSVTLTNSIINVLQCAYDPNDKINFPKGLDSNGLIPASTEYIDYTVRFQNTGNGIATNVRIEDQLHNNLNWQTLTPLSSSHNFEIHVDNFGLAKFYFNNINLPDSSANLLESQGYIKYRILLDTLLNPGSEILNSAAIFFDYNPPIITNTTTNTIYDCSELLANLEEVDSFHCFGSTIHYDSDILSTTYIWNIPNVASGLGNSVHWISDTSGFFELIVQANNSYCQTTDSIVIEVAPIYPIVLQNSIQICYGDSISIFGEYQMNSNYYYDTLTTASGCDSIISILLTVQSPILPIFDTINVCYGDSILWNGQYYYLPGNYVFTLANSLGCDSVINLQLNNYNPLIAAFDTLHICYGDSVFFNNQFYFTSGDYTEIWTSIQGCDSLIHLNLNVSSNQIISDTISICGGDSLFLSGQYQSASGHYLDTITNVFGCDSLIDTYLSVIQNTITFDTITLCQGDSVLIFGQFQSNSGNYFFQHFDINNCDSLLENVYLNAQNCAGIDEVGNDLVIVFPNPVSDKLRLTFSSGPNNYEIKFLNNIGQVVFTKTSLNEKELELDLSFMSDGVYFLEISDFDHEVIYRQKITIRK